jgi:hypothetical protein
MPLCANDPALMMTSGTNPETHLLIRRHTNEEALKGLWRSHELPWHLQAPCEDDEIQV